jgi:pantothenate kinase
MNDVRTEPQLAGIEQWASVVIEQRAKIGLSQRYLLGVVGYPGAGKSTFAGQLVAAINKLVQAEISVVVPMDGFHYSNEELDKRGLRPLKGIPDTFDAAGFVQLISRIKELSDRSVFCPKFDRGIEASIDNGIEVKPHHKIIVSEGNYLLLDKNPWNQLPKIFDEIWFINSSLEEIIPRLLARHHAGGRDEAAAKAKMESTDLPNAKLIEESRSRANRVINL